MGITIMWSMQEGKLIPVRICPLKIHFAQAATDRNGTVGFFYVPFVTLQPTRLYVVCNIGVSLLTHWKA